MTSKPSDSIHLPKPSFLDRARALMQQGRLAALPLVAATAAVGLNPAEAQAQMSVDQSFVTTYSNSGWFTGIIFDESTTSGSANGYSANLSGDHSLSDHLFWRYDNYYEKTVPRSDTTGIAFVWTGKLSNKPALSGDILRVAFDFSSIYAYTQSSNQYEEPSVNFELQIGYSADPYSATSSSTPPLTPSVGDYSKDYASYYGNNATSPLSLNRTMEISPYEGADVSNWFVFINVNWNHEYAAHYMWNDDYSKRNDDALRAFGTVSVNYVTTSAVPEPGQTALLMGLLAGIALVIRRRFTRRV